MAGFVGEIVVFIGVMLADLVAGITSGVTLQAFSVQVITSADWQEQVLQPSAEAKDSPIW